VQGTCDQGAWTQAVRPGSYHKDLLGHWSKGPKWRWSLTKTVSIMFLDELGVFIWFGHSIIEGTRESLSRLGLEYVDVIFAHRHDHNGKHKTCFFSCSFNTKPSTVPMEEIVRAFNFVIEKGWVSASLHLTYSICELTSPQGTLLGNFRVDCTRNRGSSS